MRLEILVEGKLGADHISERGMKRLTEFAEIALEYGENIGEATEK